LFEGFFRHIPSCSSFWEEIPFKQNWQTIQFLSFPRGCSKAEDRIFSKNRAKAIKIFDTQTFMKNLMHCRFAFISAIESLISK
jgi:hypothetical protein